MGNKLCRKEKLEVFKMWCWRRMERISFIEHKTNGVLKGVFDTVIFCLCLTHASQRMLAMFFAKRTDGYNEIIRILKIDLNLSSSLPTL